MGRTWVSRVQCITSYMVLHGYLVIFQNIFSPISHLTMAFVTPCARLQHAGCNRASRWSHQTTFHGLFERWGGRVITSLCGKAPGSSMAVESKPKSGAWHELKWQMAPYTYPQLWTDIWLDFSYWSSRFAFTSCKHRMPRNTPAIILQGSLIHWL